jgi:HTH-type transcriptional regulator / antitoxin HipB
MQIKTPADFGALIKSRRKALKIDQAGLANAIGVSRQWVVAVEKGQAGAEIGLVLRALNHLGLRIGSLSEGAAGSRAKHPSIDLNAIVSAGRGRRA